MTDTVFISANNGGLEIYKGVGNLIGFANIKTAKTFKYVMDTHGIDPDVRHHLHYQQIWTLLMKWVRTL